MFLIYTFEVANIVAVLIKPEGILWLKESEAGA
jgi:hypothetical protein